MLAHIGEPLLDVDWLELLKLDMGERGTLTLKDIFVSLPARRLQVFPTIEIVFEIPSEGDLVGRNADAGVHLVHEAGKFGLRFLLGARHRYVACLAATISTTVNIKFEAV